METIGWIGSMLFSICGFPQAVQCTRDGHARGLNWAYLLCWLGGEVFTLIYVLPMGNLPLSVNYLANLAFLVIMLRYKIWERNDTEIQIKFTARQI